MNILNMPRGTGKTSTLMALAAARGAYIVCRNKKEAERIFGIAQDNKLDIKFPITFSEFANKQYYGAGIKSFMIDDVDELLHYLAGVQITFCTYTAC